MFRASDIFGRRPGAQAEKTTVTSSIEAAPVKTWDPATGQFVEEDIPEDIQELMGIRKKQKTGHVDQDAHNAWGSGGAAPQGQVPRTPSKVLGPAALGLVARGAAPPPQIRSAGPPGEVDRTAPSVEYRGFSKVDLDCRYFERATVMIHGRPTYWSGDGQFFIYWQGEVQRWSICDAASFAAVKAGQLPGWAYKEDHKPLSQPSGWMEAWNGEWKTPDLEVRFRSSCQHTAQWEDPVAQRGVTTVEFHGFSMKELNTTYFIKASEVIQGRPSFWDASGTYFIYWQQALHRWAICDLKCLEAVRLGQSPGWAYRADALHFANACGWREMRLNEWCEANIETVVIGQSTRGLKVHLSGFSRQELNAAFKERADEEVQGKPTFWDPTGTYFLYWQESMQRWAILDKASLHLAKSGLAPGWAYRTDSEHFARASAWMEVWGKDWKETTVRCQVLEGSVREAYSNVKAEIKDERNVGKLAAHQYRALVKKVYEIKNPSKLQGLSAIYAKYNGKEQELYLQVCRKYSTDPEKMAQSYLYGKEDTAPAMATAVTSKQVDKQDDPYANLEDEEVPELKGKEYALLVQAAYEQYNPKKIQDLPRLLRKYQGTERGLYLEVCKKYGVHAAKFHAKYQAENQMVEPA